MGAILYHLITGEPVFKGTSAVEILRKVVEDEPTRPSKLNNKVDQDLETICLKCLEKDSDARYESAASLAEDLGRWLDQEPITARPSGVLERLIKWTRRKPLIASLCAALIGVSALGIVAVFQQWQETNAALLLTQQKVRDEVTAHAPVLKHRLLMQHDQAVVSVQFSKDGSKLLTASQDKTARIWDSFTGEQLQIFQGHDGVLSWAEFSPDGAKILTVSSDNTAYQPFLNPIGQPVYADGGPRYGDQSVRVWSIKDGSTQAILKGHTNQLTSAHFSPDGKHIVSSSHDRTAKIWDLKTQKIIHTLNGHEASVLSTIFSPDGRSVITTSAGSDNQFMIQENQTTEWTMSVISRSRHEKWIARIWDVATGEEKTRLKNRSRQGGLLSFESGKSRAEVAFSSDGRLLVSASADPKNTCIWNARSGRLKHELQGHRHDVLSAVFSPDGQMVVTASADHTARLWDVLSGNELAVLSAHDGPVLSAAFSPNGKRVITTSADKNARVWDVEKGAGLVTLQGHSDKIYSAAFSPDGLRVATVSKDHTVRIWNAATLDQLSITLRGHKDALNAVAFSPSGGEILTSSDDKTTKVWNTRDGQLITELKGLSNLKPSFREKTLGEVNSAIFSPNGRFVVTSSSDRKVIVGDGQRSSHGKQLTYTPARIWDWKSGKMVQSFKGFKTGVAFSIYSADGNRLLTASDGRAKDGFLNAFGQMPNASSGPTQDSTNAKIWNVKTGALMSILEGHTGALVGAAFSHDGGRVVTSDVYAVRVWNAHNGRLISTLDSDAARTPFVAFSPDDRYVLARRGGAQIELWDPDTGAALHRLQQRQSFLLAYYGPQGKEIISIGHNGAFRKTDSFSG
ncbi:MAG: hypothetical protein HOI66_17085, partial [Verrucomicrobia bacterium]|nr:hypothetical protein [Verrucomicrobiota bacterium]